MTIVEAKVSMPRDVVVSNLSVLSSFTEGEKPVTRDGRISKEDRVWLVAVRRWKEGAFDFCVIEQTFQRAVEMLNFAEQDKTFYHGGEQRFSEVKTINIKGPQALDKLLVIKQTYLSEGKQITADNLQAIYDRYLSTFPKGKSTSPSILKKTESVSPRDFEDKGVKEAASTARSFWKMQETASKVLSGALPIKTKKTQQVRFSTAFPQPPPLIHVPRPKTPPSAPALTMPSMPERQEVRVAIANATTVAATFLKESKKRSVPKYEEKRTISHIVKSESHETEGGWIEQLRSLGKILPDRLRQAHKDLNKSLDKAIKELNQRRRNRGVDKIYNPKLIERGRNVDSLAASSYSASGVDSDDWEDEGVKNQGRDGISSGLLVRSTSLIGPNLSSVRSGAGSTLTQPVIIKRSISLSGTDFIRNINQLPQTEESRRLFQKLSENRRKMVSDSDSETDASPDGW